MPHSTDPVAIDLALQEINDALPLDLERGLQRAARALEMARKLDYVAGGIKAHVTMARVLWELMRYREGAREAEQALQLERSRGDGASLARAWHVHALNCWGLADYLSALQSWINAMELAAQEHDQGILIESLIGVGNIWRTRQSYQLAAREHRLARRMAEDAGEDWLAGQAAILLAWDSYLLRDFPVALEALDAAERYLVDCPNPTWHAEIYDFRGQVLLELGELQLAEEAIGRAHLLAVQHKQTWMLAHSAVSLARIAFKQERLDEARELLERAYQEACQFDPGELLARICLLRTELEEHAGQPQQALAYYRRFREHDLHQVRQHYIALEDGPNVLHHQQLAQQAERVLARLMRRQPSAAQPAMQSLQRERDAWLSALERRCRMLYAPPSWLILLQLPQAQLGRLAALLEVTCSAEDLFTQYHSGELALLLSGLDEAGLERWLTQLQSQVAALPWWRDQQAAPALRWHALPVVPGNTPARLLEELHRKLEQEVGHE